MSPHPWTLTVSAAFSAAGRASNGTPASEDRYELVANREGYWRAWRFDSGAVIGQGRSAYGLEGGRSAAIEALRDHFERMIAQLTKDVG